MSKRKGVSAADKRVRLLALLRDTKRPWTGKELENEAKHLGFHAMAIPEVLQQLLDDDLCTKEKIGSANYIWSFPSSAYKKAKTNHEKIAQQLDRCNEEVEKLTKEKAELESGREETEEYLRLQDELRAKQAKLAAVQTTLRKNAANDPKALAELQELVDQIRANVNRETDNIYEVQSYLVKKRGMDRKMVKQMLGITDSFDNV